MVMTSPVVVRQCLGVMRQYRGDDPVPVHLIFRAATGGLHILAMDEPTAMAAMLAIRADVPADPDEVADARQREALARTLDGMAVWSAGQGDGDAGTRAVAAARDLRQAAGRMSVSGHARLMVTFNDNQRFRRTLRIGASLAILCFGFTVLTLWRG